MSRSPDTSMSPDGPAHNKACAIYSHRILAAMQSIAIVGSVVSAFAPQIAPLRAASRSAASSVAMAAPDEFTLAILGDLHVSF